MTLTEQNMVIGPWWWFSGHRHSTLTLRVHILLSTNFVQKDEINEKEAGNGRS